jgi:hypothetical protein
MPRASVVDDGLREVCIRAAGRCSDPEQAFVSFGSARDQLERSGSLSWNRESRNCTFTYYKECLDTTCRNPNAQPGACTAYTTRDGKQLINTLANSEFSHHPILLSIRSVPSSR